MGTPPVQSDWKACQSIVFTPLKGEKQARAKGTWVRKAILIFLSTKLDLL
jgi:hypothetical protein